MITLGAIFRDINSVFSDYSVDQTKIYAKDTTNLINQLISQLRVDHVKNGLGYEFAVTETVYTSLDDLEYPFLKYAELEYPLMRSLPIQWTVRQSVFQTTDNELLDEEQSWNVGDIVFKGKKTYKALTDVTNENTYNLTFAVEGVRNFRVNNGFKFKKGDIATDGDMFIRFTEDYVNNQNEPIEQVPADPLVWREIDTTYQEGTQVSFDRLHALKLYKPIFQHYPFSIREDRVYTPIDNTPMTITYVPEWQYVEDMDDILKIPDSMVKTVKDMTVATLARKFGVNLEPETSEE